MDDGGGTGNIVCNSIPLKRFDRFRNIESIRLNGYENDFFFLSPIPLCVVDKSRKKNEKNEKEKYTHT